MVRQSKDLAHLVNDRVRSLALGPVDDCIEYLREDQWYNFPYAAALIERLQSMLSDNRFNVRPECLRVVAPTGMAKSTILEQFVSLHPSVTGEADNITKYPVLKIELPNDASLGALYETIMAALGTPDPKLLLRKTGPYILNLLRRVQLRLLIIDEFQRLHWLPESKARLIAETAKWLANALRIPVVLAGTNQMDRIFDTDAQLGDRFKLYEIPPLLCNPGFRDMVYTILAYCPFRLKPQASIFSEKACSELIRKCAPSTDGLVRHIKKAAMRELAEGGQQMTLKALLKPVP